MDSNTLEQTDAYAASNAPAPRVTLQAMKDKIVAEHYINAGAALKSLGDIPGSTKIMGIDVKLYGPLDLITLCFLVMENGYTVVGKSACASPENYDAEKGRRFAYEDAVAQLWPLEGYLLRSSLAKA